MEIAEVQSTTPFDSWLSLPWPKGDGFAQVECTAHYATPKRAHFESDDPLSHAAYELVPPGLERVEMAWIGPKHWPLPVSIEVLQSWTPEGEPFEKYLSTRFPWPMRMAEGSPSPNYRILYRTDA